MVDMTWTSKKIAKLKELWDKGLSTSEIGKKLGVTKNSVVGKVHRLELDGRPSPIKRKDAKPSKKVAAPVKKEVKNVDKEVLKKVIVKENVEKVSKLQTAAKKDAQKKEKQKIQELEHAVKKDDVIIEEVDEVEIEPVVEDNGGVAITELKVGMCRFPIGDPKSKNFHFCGRPTFKNKPYCLEHTVVAYTPRAAKERKDAKDPA